MPALVLFILASIGCALSRSMVQLIVFRAMQGLGGAGLVAMAQASIADVIAPRERGRYQGYMASMWGDRIHRRAAGGRLAHRELSWRYVFWINLPVGLAGAVAQPSRAARMCGRARQRLRIDYPGALLLTGGITCWLLLLSWGGTGYPWLSPTILSLGAAGRCCSLLLVLQERWRPIRCCRRGCSATGRSWAG